MCISPQGEDCTAIVKRMSESQIDLDVHRPEYMAFDGGAIAVVRTSDRFSKIDMVRRSHNGSWLAIAGLPIYKYGNLEEKLRGALDDDFRKAVGQLEELDGAFVAVGWNQPSRKLYVVTDFLGMQPFYMLRNDKSILFSTDIRSLTSASDGGVQMDPAGWGAFVSFGHTIGDRTLVTGIRRVPAAWSAIVEPAALTIDAHTYWQWPQGNPSLTLSDVDTGAIAEALKRDCRSYAEYNRPGTMLLSGGFDSRLILAALKDIGVEPKALILDHADELFGIDGRFAARLADVYSIEAQTVSSSRSFYSSPDYLRYLKMSEVTAPSLYLFIAQVAHTLESDIEAVWDGAAVGPTLKAHQPKGAFAEYLREKVSPWNSPRWIAARNVFGKVSAQKMYDAFKESLQQELAKYPDSDFGVSQFILQNRNRNRTIPNPLKVYANYALPFTPGFSKDYCTLTMTIPFSVKNDAALARTMMSRHFPAANTVPVVSGAAVYHSRNQGWSPFAFRVLNKLQQNSVCKLVTLLGRRVFQGTWNGWEASSILNRTIERINSDHPDLCKESVFKICKTRPRMYKGICYRQQELLFYWQMWRWILEGQTNVDDLFGKNAENSVIL